MNHKGNEPQVTNFVDQIATKSQRRKHDHDNEMITEHNINKV